MLQTPGRTLRSSELGLPAVTHTRLWRPFPLSSHMQDLICDASVLFYCGDIFPCVLCVFLSLLKHWVFRGVLRTDSGNYLTLPPTPSHRTAQPSVRMGKQWAAIARALYLTIYTNTYFYMFFYYSLCLCCALIVVFNDACFIVLVNTSSWGPEFPLG